MSPLCAHLPIRSFCVQLLSEGLCGSHFTPAARCKVSGHTWLPAQSPKGPQSKLDLPQTSPIFFPPLDDLSPQWRLHHIRTAPGQAILPLCRRQGAREEVEDFESLLSRSWIRMSPVPRHSLHCAGRPHGHFFLRGTMSLSSVD